MTRQAEELLVRFGSMHVKTLITLALLIFSVGVISFFVFWFFNKKRPEGERKSNFTIFLYALMVSFFTTVLIFVYRFVFIGIQVLMNKSS